MPAPMLGVQVSPSSSVKAIRLTFDGRSCETMVRLVWRSVKRIGSKVTIEVVRPERSTQFAVPLESLKPLTRSVSRPEMNMTLPLDQFTPRVGSPAPCPSGAGAAKFAYDGAGVEEAGGRLSAA